jgi:hypothetical protein
LFDHPNELGFAVFQRDTWKKFFYEHCSSPFEPDYKREKAKTSTDFVKNFHVTSINFYENFHGLPWVLPWMEAAETEAIWRCGDGKKEGGRKGKENGEAFGLPR